MRGHRKQGDSVSGTTAPATAAVAGLTETEAERGVASPAVGHVASVLAERIEAGEYRGGQMLPSERALAEEFGVSRVTVRQAVEDLERRDLVVRSARCRPIVRANGKGTGEEAFAAASTARRSVALWLWPGPTDPGASMILNGVRSALPMDDFRIILECPGPGDDGHLEEPEARFLRRIQGDADVEGVILWYLGGVDNRPALEAVRASGRPLVFLDRLPPAGFDSDFVGVDNVEAAAAVTRHLIARGHRRIVHVTNREKVSTVFERQEGYRKAMAAAGLPATVLTLQTDRDAPELARRIVALRQESAAEAERPTAAFVVNDYGALHLVDALRADGLRVPEDFAVAGFDGIERWLPGRPFLTTVCQPFEKVGARAAEMLLERLADRDRPYRHVILEAALHAADSTRTGASEEAS